MDFLVCGKEFTVQFDRGDTPKVRRAVAGAAVVLCLDAQKDVQVLPDRERPEIVRVILAQDTTAGSAIDVLNAEAHLTLLTDIDAPLL